MQFLMTFNENFETGKSLLGIFAGVASAALALRAGNRAAGAEKISKQNNAELTPNGGGSLNDKVTRAADDSAEALDIIKSRDAKWTQTEKSLEELKQRFSTMTESQNQGTRSLEHSFENLVMLQYKQRQDFEKLELKFARFTVHESNQTLPGSNLAIEEKRLLDESKKRADGSLLDDRMDAETEKKMREAARKWLSGLSKDVPPDSDEE